MLQAFVSLLALHNLIDVPNDQGQTLLHQACFHGSVGAVKVLLNAGAAACTSDHTGSTPLSAALRRVCLDGWQLSPGDWPTDWLGDWVLTKTKALLIILDLLLNAGADTSRQTESKNLQPLDYAILAAWRLKSAACVGRLCAHHTNTSCERLVMR